MVTDLAGRDIRQGRQCFLLIQKKRGMSGSYDGDFHPAEGEKQEPTAGCARMKKKSRVFLPSGEKESRFVVRSPELRRERERSTSFLRLQRETSRSRPIGRGKGKGRRYLVLRNRCQRKEQSKLQPFLQGWKTEGMAGVGDRIAKKREKGGKERGNLPCLLPLAGPDPRGKGGTGGPCHVAVLEGEREGCRDLIHTISIKKKNAQGPD